MKYRLLIVLTGLMLQSVTTVSFGQTRQEKTTTIINRLNLVKSQKSNYEFQLESLKYLATKDDSVKIVALEKQLSEEFIASRISLAFNELFTDEEINVTYEFTQTTAFEKFIDLDETYKAISSKFLDIDKEITELTKNLSEPAENTTRESSPDSVDKEDGFYATVKYFNSSGDSDIKLADKPALTPKDILKAEKVYNNNRPEVSIEFTKEGARKFYLLTKENIGNSIAIVIAKRIVSMPRVNAEIMGGKAIISGNFTNEETDEMIKRLKKK